MGEASLKQVASLGIAWISSVVSAKNGLVSVENGADLKSSFCQLVASGKLVLQAEKFWKITIKDQLNQLGLARELGVRVLSGPGVGGPGILHGSFVVIGHHHANIIII